MLGISVILSYNYNTSRYVVPTDRVVVTTWRYIVPAGKVIFIVSTGRLNLVPTGSIFSPGSVKNLFQDKILVC